MKVDGMSGRRMVNTWDCSKWEILHVRLMGTETAHGNRLKQQKDISLQAEKTGVPGPASHIRGANMRQVHCDGCGFTESVDTPRKNRKIKDTTLQVVNDSRFPEGTGTYTADLCPGCLHLLLHQYFNIPSEGKLDLDVPSFLVPDDLEVELWPQSKASS